MGRFHKDIGNDKLNGTVSLLVDGDRRPVVCDRCVVADTPLRRLKGLLGRKGLASGEGILLYPASSIHTWFMRFPIDAVFVDRELSVVGISADVAPWHLTGRRRARAVLELPAGECRRRGIEIGDRLRVEHV